MVRVSTARPGGTPISRARGSPKVGCRCYADVDHRESAAMSASARVRVLIADDHPMIRTGLARMVAAEPDLEVVGTAADGRRAVELAEREQPDVIVLDLSMPELDGITATEEMRRRSPRARVLVLS